MPAPVPGRAFREISARKDIDVGKMDEMIVVASREDVFGPDSAGVRGFVPLTDALARNAIRGLCSRPFTARRGDVENDDSLLQPIPYVVLTREAAAGERQIFAYARLPGGGETRLHGRLSIGVGGHMNRCFDEDSFLATVMDEAGRELAEELVFSDAHGEEIEPPAIRLVGMIHDDSDPVQRVHLALVAVVEIPDGVRVAVRETEQLDGRWTSSSSLDRTDLRERLEKWSHHALAGLGLPTLPQ